VRVLIDYRSALRGRSGVGEYAHELVGALLRGFPQREADHRLEVTIFSSSWKDRLRVSPDLNGVRSIDLHVPVSLLNFAWHRFGWPGAERLTHASFDVTHSLHPLLLPATRAAQVVTIHDLNFLKAPERTTREIRRDYPALARRHAQAADRIIVNSNFTAGEVEREFGIPADRISICPPGAPAWTPRQRTATAGYILFVGTLEPRKNIGGLLDAYERLISSPAKAGPHDSSVASASGVASGFSRTIPELVLAGSATGESDAWLERIARPPVIAEIRMVERHLHELCKRDRSTAADLVAQNLRKRRHELRLWGVRMNISTR